MVRAHTCVQVTLTQKQLHDICTATKLAGKKTDINRVLMEGVITTEPEQSEEAPESPVVVNCDEMLADRQIVTQLVGGGPLPTQLVGGDTEYNQSSTITSTDEAKREKAKRKKKLQAERDRGAKEAAEGATATAAAATATAATSASASKLLGAFDGVD